MTSPRILVVEDEMPIRRFLRIALESAGMTMLEADRGRLGIERAATEAPDVVVLDLGLPDMDGRDAILAIREWSQMPILVLSVRDAETDKIAALDAGADDYVTKPFATGELLARLRALLRARRPQSVETSALRFEDIVIDFAAHTVTRGGANVGLTRKEFDVLALLARHAGRLVTHSRGPHPTAHSRRPSHCALPASGALSADGARLVPLRAPCRALAPTSAR